MRFIATFHVNYRNNLEVKDAISSLDRFASCLYRGKHLRQMQSNNRGIPLITLEGIQMKFIANSLLNFRNIPLRQMM